ncbi:hypothetical protein [Micromonospora maritima]|uniref:hypothetical protein n=1 Tax=Micromonospora maritima TaxID=986711 RepID=UPI00157C2EF0|nr:hypothetical protein [Micromonospora maritima]
MADRGFRTAGVHRSHLPESDEERLVAEVIYCKVCCRAVSTALRGPSRAGKAPCEGPGRLGFRFNNQVVVGEVVQR